VSGVIVNDEMEIETGGGLLVDQFEKGQELTMSMQRHATAGRPRLGAIEGLDLALFIILPRPNASRETGEGLHKYASARHPPPWRTAIADHSCAIDMQPSMCYKFNR
jgi:hypothetical protein